MLCLAPLAPAAAGPRPPQRRARVTASAHASKVRRAENAPGDWFVDGSCIDCDTCRWMDPGTFVRAGGASAVARQPEDPAARLRAAQAMAACPTGSIRTEAPCAEAREAAASFPFAVDEAGLPGVSHLGFHAAHSYGAASWFLEGTGAGNVMVDCPRFNSQLARRLEARGGVDWIVLTHRDDVADHARWKARFPGARRVIHRLEVNVRQGTDACEVILDGDGPHWAPFSHGESPGGGDTLRVVFTPGHTGGSVTLSYARGDGALFTGDHLAFQVGLGRVGGFRRACWYSWDEQVRSVARLADLDGKFLHVLPGHGAPHRFASRDAQVAELRAAAGAMAAQR